MGEVKSLFKKAENAQGFLKMGIMGFPGSGKTFTATEIAIAMAKYLKEKRPVFALDTEKGFEYVADKFKKAGVELQVARTRAFVDLLAAIDEAEKNASILLIDSVTHFWQEVQDAYKKEVRREKLRFQDWGPIKANWGKFTEKYLNSQVHIIMCGRAGDAFDYFEDADGDMQLKKTGTKMQAEKNLGYEPGLAVEMERVRLGDFKAGERSFVNRAYVLKDRFDVIDGKFFDDPTFNTFLPHIAMLNLGAHEPLSGADSTALFDKNSDKNWLEERKQAGISLEEIEGEITSQIPGQSADAKKQKADLLQEIFGTRSWTAIGEKKAVELRDGLKRIKEKAVVGGAK